jgi:hypothetical protein
MTQTHHYELSIDALPTRLLDNFCAVDGVSEVLFQRLFHILSIQCLKPSADSILTCGSPSRVASVVLSLNVTTHNYPVSLPLIMTPSNTMCRKIGGVCIMKRSEQVVDMKDFLKAKTKAKHGTGDGGCEIFQLTTKYASLQCSIRILVIYGFLGDQHEPNILAFAGQNDSARWLTTYLLCFSK